MDLSVLARRVANLESRRQQEVARLFEVARETVRKMLPYSVP